MFYDIFAGGSLIGPISLTALRNNLFKVIDQVIQTGNPVIVERKGHRLNIVLEEEKSKLDNLKPHDCIIGNPHDLVQMKVAEWHESDNL